MLHEIQYGAAWRLCGTVLCSVWCVTLLLWTNWRCGGMPFFKNQPSNLKMYDTSSPCKNVIQWSEEYDGWLIAVSEDALYKNKTLLTPWSRVLLEKLIGSQILKKFPAFYGTRRFITAFSSARHLSISRASSIQSMPPHIPLPKNQS